MYIDRISVDRVTTTANFPPQKGSRRATNNNSAMVGSLAESAWLGYKNSVAEKILQVRHLYSNLYKTVGCFD